MYELDFSKPINIFFCGIGGISMSALAEVLLDAGFKVSGSDRAESDLTKKLSKNGAQIFIGQKGENISADIEVFVYTAAIHKDHPEYQKAEELGIPILTRAELLGQMMKNYKTPIGISGTHGKTTVTSMVSEILMGADTDPTLLVGGILDSIDGNLRIGHSDLFVTEACEYTNSFLSFFPKISVILNVEEDHLDFFKDIHDIRNSFNRFALLPPKDGAVIINGDMEGFDVVTRNVSADIITFGEKNTNDYSAKDIHVDDDGKQVFTVVKGDCLDEFKLSVPGKHNVLNALCAIAVADYLNVDREVTKKALLSFRGAERRFEYKGELNGIEIYDDYAHHPSEIAATLSAAASVKHNKLWVVFQPHTFTRTKAFMNEFADSLSKADAVILADIYAAREKDNLGISSDTLKHEVSKRGTESYYFDSFEKIEEFIKNNCAPSDMLITMGAGNVVDIAHDLLKE